MPTAVAQPPSSTSSALATRFRWFIVGLLFIATTINYIDRQTLALLKPILDQQLHWSNTDFGFINSVFFGVYAASYAVFGRLIDRVGVKLGYGISITWWSLAAVLHAFVGSVRGFLFVRIALGAGEGGNFPACIKAIAHWFPKRERALAASLFNNGANIGPVIAPAIVPWIAYTFGWQMSFVVAGVAGFLWLLLWVPFYADSPAQSRFVSAAELQTIESDHDTSEGTVNGVSWIGLFTIRETWSIVLAKFLTDPVWWFFLIWLPDFFMKTRALDLRNSWPHLVTIYSISTVLSVVGGWFTGKLIKNGWTATRARKTGMLLFAVCVLPVFFAPRSGNWTAVMLIGLAGAAHQAWSANIYAVISDIFPKRAVAAIAGIGGMAGALGGMLFPMFTGALLDYYHKAGNETTGYAILFAICSSAYVVAFAINHVLAPRFEHLELGANSGKHA
jgi:MFS transporter, ACS family, hexuronate transporter